MIIRAASNLGNLPRRILIQSHPDAAAAEVKECALGGPDADRVHFYLLLAGDSSRVLRQGTAVALPIGEEHEGARGHRRVRDRGTSARRARALPPGERPDGFEQP